MSVDVWGELITNLVLNAFVTLLFGLANRKAYKSSKGDKKVMLWKVLYFITAFFFLFYLFTLIVIVCNGFGFPDGLKAIVSLISIPLIVVIYRKLLVRWRKNEKASN